MLNIGLEAWAQCLLKTYTGIQSILTKDAFLASALQSFDQYIKLYIQKNVVTMHWQEMVFGELVTTH